MSTVRETIEQRRAYRSLAPVDISEELIEDLATCAGLAPSCFNHQPWRFVFVHEPEALDQVKEALSEGNAWATAASLIIAVYSRREDDCVIHDREYHLFDTGLATAFLILRATERGLVAHPIAGYSPVQVREALGIPDDCTIITLVIVGRHAARVSPLLSDKQRQAEQQRPERKPLSEIACHNRHCHPEEG
ncbi:MAG: nitroreductase family protein [Thermoplasmatota archaeon]